MFLIDTARGRGKLTTYKKTKREGKRKKMKEGEMETSNMEGEGNLSVP